MNAAVERVQLGLHRKALRVRAGLKQGELAQRAGLSRPTVQKAEAGDPSVTLDSLDAIARALGLDLREYERLPAEVATPTPAESTP